MVSFVSSSCLWFILMPKMLQLCTNHPVLVLCKFVWVIEACQFFLVLSQSCSTPLYHSKMLQARERPRLLILLMFSVWDSHLSPSRSWEHVIFSWTYWYHRWTTCWWFCCKVKIGNYRWLILSMSFGFQGMVMFTQFFQYIHRY
jgi:hypothetical protein